MKNIKRRTISLCLALTFVLSLFLGALPTGALAAGDSSGQCGDNLTWTLDEDGTLEISGTGDMWDYGFGTTSPWGNSIKTVILDKDVTSIGNRAFWFCPSLRGVTLPAGLTRIGNQAFSNCFQLKSIGIPDSVTEVGSSAFAYCNGLESVTIPVGVASIGLGAFSGCWNLTKIDVDADNANYKSIDGVLFSLDGSTLIQCPGGKEGNYVIPPAVASVGVSAFAYCDVLESIVVHAGVTDIGRSAFASCEDLGHIDVDANNPNYKDIDGVLFSKDGTTLIQYPGGKAGDYTIPAGVEKIGYNAFFRCKMLGDIRIPDSVISIDYWAFLGSNLVENQHDGVVYIDGWALDYEGAMPEGTTLVLKEGTRGIANSAFVGEMELVDVVIPDSVKHIGGGAFSNCAALEKITFPTELVSIGDYAFQGCGFETVIIPADVTSIGDYAFSNCERLTRALFQGDAPTSFGSFVFFGVEPGFAIYYDPDTFGWSTPRWNDYLALSNTAEGIRGQCGDDLTWTMNLLTGTLEISGTGDMWDFYFNPVPWSDVKRNILTVSVLEGVTRIGNAAFDNCGNLKNVHFPESLQSIGEFAFSYCGLKRVVIPAGVTEIERCAFVGCMDMADIAVDKDNSNYISIDGVLFSSDGTTLVQCPGGKEGVYAVPEDVEYIGEQAFGNCWKLTDVTLPDRLEAIGDYAFSGNDGLERLFIPAQVTDIKRGALSNCKRLICIDVHEDNPSFASRDGALYDKGFTTLIQCPGGKLGILEIPEGVTSIGDNACEGCRELSGVKLPESLLSIGDGAFIICKELKDVAIPAEVTSIGQNAFGFCWSLTDIIVADENKYYASENGMLFDKDKTTLLLCPAGQSGQVEIPEDVSSIEENAFGYCHKITGVTLPNSLTHIGAWAFDACDGLLSIRIPAGVTEIGRGAFSYCLGMISIDVDKDNLVYSSEEGVLFNKDGTMLIACPGRKTGKYAIPEGVVSIEDLAFFGCLELTGITIPNSVKRVGMGVFSNTSAYRNQSNGVVYIDGWALGYQGVMQNKTTIVLRDGTRGIADYAFERDYRLVDVVIPTGVKYIGEGAFYSTNLTNLVLPNGVESIGREAFSDCAALKSVDIPASVASIGDWAFYNCTALGRVNIPVGVASIGEWAFFKCTALERVDIPVGAKSIGEGAFYGCTALERVTIPASVTSIGPDTFENCSNLTIHCYANSFAERYAKDNDICYTLIPETVTYTITVSATNGTITPSKTSAKAGEIITLTVTPSQGYELVAGSLKMNGTEIANNRFTMPAMNVTVTASFKKAGGETPPPPPPTTPPGDDTVITPPNIPLGGLDDVELTFTDVKEGDWFYKPVRYVFWKGLFGGTSETRFSPNTPMTRAMFAKVLANLAGVDLKTYTTSPFADVDIKAWYGPEVAWAADKGLVTGVGDGKFAPNRAITREEMAVFLYRYIKFRGYDMEEKSVTPFADMNQVSPWAKTEVTAVQKWGLLSGVGDNLFAPKRTASRAQVAQIFYNLLAG